MALFLRRTGPSLQLPHIPQETPEISMYMGQEFGLSPRATRQTGPAVLNELAQGTASIKKTTIVLPWNEKPP